MYLYIIIKHHIVRSRSESTKRFHRLLVEIQAPDILKMFINAMPGQYTVLAGASRETLLMQLKAGLRKIHSNLDPLESQEIYKSVAPVMGEKYKWPIKPLINSVEEDKMEHSVFLSYADYEKNKHLISNISEKLKMVGFDVFYAQRDLNPGVAWRQELVEEIKKRKFFLALLTSEYHTSGYPDHEFGIAVGNDKEMILVRVDSDHTQYGLIDTFQTVNVIPERGKNVEEWRISEEIILAISKMIEKTLDNLDYHVSSLIKSSTYNETNYHIEKIVGCNLKPKQCVDIAQAFLTNNQIFGTGSKETYELAAMLKNAILEPGLLDKLTTSTDTADYFQ